MRFRKGSQIEVFSNNGAPYGAWRCAEILSGNGHTYSVKYDSSRFAAKDMVVEKIPRKNIRPCPPQVDVERWESGELVEVHDDFSWKIATILKGLGGNFYLVRLLGDPTEFEAHKVNIRVRQYWQDDKWNLIGKVSGSLKSSTQMRSDLHKKHANLTNSLLREPSIASSRMLKRMSPCGWLECAESCTGNPRKVRSIEKEGQKQRYYSSSLRKVDIDDAHVQDFFKNQKNCSCEMEKVRSNGFDECVRAGSSETNGYDSDACSVGSCSAVSYDESNIPSGMVDYGSIDSESLCGYEEEEEDDDDEEGRHNFIADFAGKSHRSKLYTYRATLGELFASGAITWEQEASLTDLRLSLNISDEEHLMELKSLISAGNRGNIC